MGGKARTVFLVGSGAIIEWKGAEKVQPSVPCRGLPGQALAERGKQIICTAHGPSSFTVPLKTSKVGKIRLTASLFVGALVATFCGSDPEVSLF